MKYLFFDVECSNCHDGVGKICEFGYVLTDENFKIISQDDIPMSPGKGKRNAFDLVNRKDDRDITLSYEYYYYLSCPEFPYFYNRIQKLMEDPSTISFAYSMDNDINHIHKTCLRYKLKPLKYICYDVQIMVAHYLNKRGRMNLELAFKEIVGPHYMNDIIPHLSRDDAKMEMMIMEAICVLEQKNSKELLEESPFAKVESVTFMNDREARMNRRKEKDDCHYLYREEVRRCLPLVDKEEYIGKRYNVSGDIKKRKATFLPVLEIVKRLGGIFVNGIDKADYFIVLNEENKNELNEKFSGAFKGEFILLEDFLKK